MYSFICKIKSNMGVIYFLKDISGMEFAKNYCLMDFSRYFEKIINQNCIIRSDIKYVQQ